jgi:hypothetical protein
LVRLNKFRAEFGFAPLPQPPFNNYIDEAVAAEAAGDVLRLLEIEQFSSTYYLGTRVFKPLLAKLLDNAIDPARADMELNRLFSLLPSVGDYGVQKLFIYQRK